ncbi:MAG TPA: SURF1 family protein [Castellaniella sp.]|uniref:SURF1 family protein n=1 Tax=Castellaniella sp. TaxID=1955812 RepID=UPI002EF087C6
MTASPTRSHTKALVGIVLLILLGSVCLQAGRWQLGRAGQREALSAAMQAGRVAPRMILDAQHPQGPDWHPAAATGHWLNQFTVLLDNRNLQGEPGFWVATPLALTATPHTALLVLRGWVPRPLPPATLPDLRTADGSVTVDGTMLSHVPRIFDLGSITGHYDTALPSSWPAADGHLPRVQNLALSDLQRATGLTFLPVVLEQSPTHDAGLVQDWPGPSLNATQNYNYAGQWFSFATIALLAAAFMTWRIWHPRSSPASPKAPPTT